MALQEEFESQGNFLFRYRGNLPLIIVFVGIFVFVFDKLSLLTDKQFRQE